MLHLHSLRRSRRTRKNVSFSGFCASPAKITEATSRLSGRVRRSAFARILIHSSSEGATVLSAFDPDTPSAEAPIMLLKGISSSSATAIIRFRFGAVSLRSHCWMVECDSGVRDPSFRETSAASSFWDQPRASRLIRMRSGRFRCSAWSISRLVFDAV